MTFDDRGQNFENKFKHDQELQFKVEVRLAKLFGAWVAGQLGLGDEAAATYAKELVGVQLEQAGNNDIIARAAADLTAAGKEIALSALEAKVGELEALAKQQIMGES